jgi:hypothetical protein
VLIVTNVDVYSNEYDNNNITFLSVQLSLLDIQLSYKLLNIENLNCKNIL